MLYGWEKLDSSIRIFVVLSHPDIHMNALKTDQNGLLPGIYWFDQEQALEHSNYA